MNLVTRSLTAAFVEMTKEVVDALLNLNTRNRNQRQLVTNTYQRAIEGGMWVPTSQGIGVAADGFLVDGQHRLLALRAAGYPSVVMLVVTGLPEQALAAVDSGANRSARDYLSLMFETKVSSLVAAILRTSLLACDEFPANTKYQPQEYADHLDLIGNSIHEILHLEGVNRMAAPVIAAIADAHHKGYQQEARSFAKALVTGELLERGNPALVLRNWLNTSKGYGGAEMMIQRYRKTMRAIQAWIDNQPLTKLYRSRTPLTTTEGGT